MQELAIEIKNLNKTYHKVTALKDISFAVHKGELFGLIGPDGAGKTSLLRILASLLIPDSGTAMMEGFDVVKDYKEIRKIVGYMPGRFSLYYDLTVEENLSFFASIFGTTIRENYDLIKDIYFQIEPFKKRKAGNLSGGMKQKLALSCALIHKPKVLILDEPTTGVDAVSRKEFWDMLKQLKAQGITVIVSTPYMDEAGLCDRIALIQDGSILKINSPDGVVNDYKNPVFGITADNMYALMTHLKAYNRLVSAHRFGDSIHTTLSTEDDRAELQQHLQTPDIINLRIEKIEPTIEDCFMALIEEKSDE
ncbi:MAG: ABC transporter ATP-binding protein [Bacteroidales bacterium]|nr:ABC transporter ATP-binding protein [Bacteroidales bacterium]MCF8403534.1 ABC transporter ATP-binding protein [Bacteroidales bacterium]